MGNCNFISSGSGQAAGGNPARSNGLGQQERGRLVLEVDMLDTCNENASLHCSCCILNGCYAHEYP